ncbi:MAG: thioredoxin [Limisphaerales bacterium]
MRNQTVLIFASLATAIALAISCSSSGQREFSDPKGTNGKKDTVDFTLTSFKTQVLDATNSVVLVDFWASWCGPCRKVAPTVDAVAERYQGRAIVGKVDVDKEKDIAAYYQIRGIPCLMVFKDGKSVDKIVGIASYDEISQMLDRHL